MIRVRLFVCTRDAVWIVDVCVYGRRVAPVRLRPARNHHALTRARKASVWAGRRPVVESAEIADMPWTGVN